MLSTTKSHSDSVAVTTLSAWSARRDQPNVADVPKKTVSQGEQEYQLRLGQLIVALRGIVGMSQATLAERVERSEAALSRWEGGKSTPSAFDVRKIADTVRDEMRKRTDLDLPPTLDLARAGRTCQWARPRTRWCRPGSGWFVGIQATLIDVPSWTPGNLLVDRLNEIASEGLAATDLIDTGATELDAAKLEEGSDRLLKIEPLVTSASAAFAGLERNRGFSCSGLATEPEPEPTAAPAINVWSRAFAVTALEGLGFSGEESPLNDGTPRWLARGPDNSIGEIMGDPDNIDEIGLTVIAGEEGGQLAGFVIGLWLPESIEFFQEVMASYSGIDLDESRDFADGTLRVQTITASDGALIIMSISR